MRKLLVISGVSVFLLLSYINLKSFSTGIGGRTRKQINEPEIGCSCHRVPWDLNVLVRILGPQQVYRNDTAVYRVTMTGGPHIKGGFDFNVGHGGIDVAEPDSTQNFGADITHRFPKIFGGRDTIGWNVKYIAPNIAGPDTLFATGNSVNGNGLNDTLDRWNFSDDFIVNIIPIGIRQINSEVPGKFSLYQNYPNPFNPKTNIKFKIAKKSFVSLKIFDISGKLIDVLVDREEPPGTYEVDFDGDNIPSGIYFYRLESGTFNVTRRMILVK